MKISASTLAVLLSLLLGAFGFSACKKEEGPVAREAPKKRAVPVDDEPAVDPIDPQRIEQAMKITVEPDPPEMAEEPAEMKDDTKAADPSRDMAENEEEETEEEDGMAAKPGTPTKKHTH